MSHTHHDEGSQLPREDVSSVSRRLYFSVGRAAAKPGVAVFILTRFGRGGSLLYRAFSLIASASVEVMLDDDDKTALLVDASCSA